MATASHEVALDTFVDSGTHAYQDQSGERWSYRVADLGPFQLLDVAASRDFGARRLTISVVNRDPDQPIGTRIYLHDAEATGCMTLSEVNADKLSSVNSFTDAGAVSVRSSRHEVSGDDIDVIFPPHSFTVLEVPLA